MKAFTVKTRLEAVVFAELWQIVPLASAAANPTLTDDSQDDQETTAPRGCNARLDVISFVFPRLDGFRPARSM
jgi:hypothetical protein